VVSAVRREQWCDQSDGSGASVSYPADQVENEAASVTAGGIVEPVAKASEELHFFQITESERIEAASATAGGTDTPAAKAPPVECKRPNGKHVTPNREAMYEIVAACAADQGKIDEAKYAGPFDLYKNRDNLARHGVLMSRKYNKGGETTEDKPKWFARSC
jgi:hypothetical protein